MILLSPPHLNGLEQGMVADALTSGWVAPLGPHVDLFEREVADYVGVAAACATSSGTAALHLALLAAGVGKGDIVWCQSMTFCASANPILYVGATPVFVDSESATWNIDPDLVDEQLELAAMNNRLPKALIAVDLYGTCANYPRLERSCAKYGVMLIEDAAESLGATLAGRKAGSFGHCAILSFNGNKIITTGGGGMLVSNDPMLVAKARWLASQAKEPAGWYEHREVGYNYRLSNISAAIGRAQLTSLDAYVQRRRHINARYAKRLPMLAGDEGSSHWLSVALVADPASISPDRVEVRRAWKPMHLQPLYAGARMFGGAVSEQAFATGLCLPSGSAMTDADVDAVCEAINAY